MGVAGGEVGFGEGAASVLDEGDAPCRRGLGFRKNAAWPIDNRPQVSNRPHTTAQQLTTLAA